MHLFLGKKGQFYLFTAIILLTYAFTIAKPASLSREKADAFQELHENFATESPIAVNSALSEQANVSARFSQFAGNFSAYARTKSPAFRLAYVLRDKESLMVGNHLGISINVTQGSTPYFVNDSTTLTIPAGDIQLVVLGNRHYILLTGTDYEIRAIFLQQSSTERRVYLS